MLKHTLNMRSSGIFIAMALLMHLGCEGRSSTSPPVHAGPRYLALGDSYTIGETVDAQDRWPVQLARMLRAQHVDVADPEIIATTGWTTDELSAGMDRAAPRGPYAMVSLLIGVNNQFRGRSIDEFHGQFAGLLKRAIALAGDQSSRVIVLSIPDWGVTPFAQGRDRALVGQQIDQFNSVCRDECAKANVAFVDITPISKHAAEDPSLVADDGLHPSGKMYTQWCQAALPAAKACCLGK